MRYHKDNIDFYNEIYNESLVEDENELIGIEMVHDDEEED
jgi:hypothetical protein